jgi:SAM-dependent methyltransferase
MMPPPDPEAWLGAMPVHLRPALAGCASGKLAANVALMRLAIEAAEAVEVENALARAVEENTRRVGNRREAKRLCRALALWRNNPQAFGTVKAVLEAVAPSGIATDVEPGLARWSEAFDRAAAVSPEGCVALYALGNPDLLHAATAEVVAWMQGRGLLRGGTALDLGCGIGRFVEALAGKFAVVIGIDISAAMIARARARCGHLPGVTLRLASGRDLDGIVDRSTDFVLAADVFPYLVHAGEVIVDRHFRELARIMPGGSDLVVLNYSYRGDLKRDQSDLAALAERHGFRLCGTASGDFQLWDAATFLLRRG